MTALLLCARREPSSLGTAMPVSRELSNVEHRCNVRPASAIMQYLYPLENICKVDDMQVMFTAGRSCVSESRMSAKIWHGSLDLQSRGTVK